MIEDVNNVLSRWERGDKDYEAARGLYALITNTPTKMCPRCYEKWVMELRKYQFKNANLQA